MHMTLIEPDVALTDFGLAVECALFAAWLGRPTGAGGNLRRWFVVLFAALAVASLLGGITHGFLPEGSPGAAQAWLATLAAIAVAALASWAVGAHVALAQRARAAIVGLGIALFVANVAVALLVSQSFLVAIAFYAPAVAFAFAAFTVAYWRCRQPVLLFAVGGVALTLAAAVIQQQPNAAFLGLSHNALYHVVQAVGLALIFVTASRLGERAFCQTADEGPGQA
jgi:hypothetical protein